MRDARALVEKVRIARRPCAVNFPYRMLPPLRALRAWLSEHTARHLVITVRNHFVPTDALEPRTWVGRSADLEKSPAVEPDLATVEEAATVQRILSAAMASEDDGRRIPLG